MQKVVTFLEKHVQWVAIGLGGIYLLWMVWTYVLNSPVTVQAANGQTFTPGKIDQHVYADAATQLESAMKNDRLAINIPTPDLNNILVAFNQTAPLPAIASTLYNSQTVPVNVPGAMPADGTAVATTMPGQKMAPVAQLPKPKGATELTVQHGRSSAYVPPPMSANPNPAGGAPGGPGGEGAVAAAPQPVAGGGAMPAVGPNGQPIAGTDLDWITVMFKVPMADLAQQFTACNIPATFKTSYIDVQLIRQEKDTGGNWGPDQPVPALTIHQGNGRPSFPDAKANNNVVLGYLQWAQANPPVILQPTFYTVLKGDAWGLPGVQLANANQPGGPGAAGMPFDPNQPLTPQQIQALTPEQKLAYQRAQYQKRQEEAKARAAQHQSSRPPTGGPRGPGGGTDMPEGGMGPGGPGTGRPPGHAPNDPGRPTGRPAGPAGPAGPGGPYPGGPGGYPPGYRPGPGGYGPGYRPGGEITDMPEGEMPGQQQPVENQLNPNYSTMFPLPPGEFDPRLVVPGAAPAAQASAVPANQQMNEVTAWTHDASVQPGKTYRYKIRYRIKNPMWRINNLVANKAMAESFYIDSEDSAWTDDVRVPQLTNFFVTSISPTGTTAKVEVFRYQDGVLHSNAFTCAPGDQIGKSDKGIDYNTGFTVVDVSKDPNDPVVLVIDPNGAMLRRSSKADANSPDYQKLKQQHAQAQAAANANGNLAGATGAGGVAGGGATLAGSRGPGG